MKEKIKIFMKHPLFSGSAIMVGGTMMANVINYVYHLVMGRNLGPVDYGVLASIYSILYLVGIIPTSASMAIVKFVSSAEHQEVYSIFHAIRKFVFKLSIFLSILVFFLSPLISDFLKIQNPLSIMLISPILFLTLTTLVNQSTSQGLLKFTGTVIPTLISSLIKLFLGLLLVFLGWSVVGATFAIVVGLGLAFVYSHLFIKRILPKTKIKKYDLKKFFKYSIPVLLQALAFTSLFSTDVLLVKHFFDPFQAGIYAALSTLGKIIYFATSPVVATMFPIVSKRQNTGENYRKVFWLTMLAVFGISSIVTLLYWLFPGVAINLLYGSEYLLAKGYLAWMGLFMLFFALTHLLINYSLSLGKVKVVAIPLVGAFLQIILIWFLHNDILTVIKISLIITIVMFLSVGVYLKYNSKQ